MIKYFLLILSVFLMSFVSENSNSAYILLPGTYHDGEVPFSLKPVLWYGLYLENRQYVIRPCSVNFTRVHDLVTDMEEEQTGFRVTASDAENLVVLLDTSLISTSRKIIAPEAEFPVRIDPDDTLELSMPEASGYIITAHDGSSWLEFEEVQQKLTEVYAPGSDEHLELIWAGDLDGDGKIDLLMNDILHYNTWINYRLFLSTAAAKGELVGEVAQLIAVGC